MNIDSPPRYASIKWKLFFVSSCILLAVISLYVYGSYQFLQHQFNERLLQISAEHKAHMDSLLKQTVDRLQQLAGQAAILKEAFQESEKQKAALSEQYSYLKMSSGIHSIEFYGIGNEAQVILGEGISPASLIQKTSDEEEPHWEVVCVDDCMLVVSVPVILRNGSVGVVSVSTSLDSVLLGFNDITGCNVALLIRNLPDDGPENILSWSVAIQSMTNDNESMALLRSLSSRYSFKQARQGIIHGAGQNYYWIHVLPLLNKLSDADHEYLLFTDEVTEVRSGYQFEIFKRSLYGLAVWIFLETVFLAMLWKPAHRVRKLAYSLQKLTSNNFIKLKPEIKQLENKSFLKDESDCLLDSTLNLLNQMENLQSQLQQRASLLEERKIELENEKKFVTCLLDTAHVLILTQSSRCKIQMINRYGLSMIGKPEGDTLGSSFIALLPYSEKLPNLRFRLNELSKGVRNNMSHESDLYGRNGKKVTMAWFHSRLPQRDEYGYQILTVALDISQRKQAEEHMGWLASHDALTGLVNRRRFSEELEKILKSSTRYQRKGAVLFFDLDQFKDVNDSSGHHVGDDLLKKVAKVLLEQSRETDIIARLGGDEFAIILLEADELKAGEIADRLCKALTRIEVKGGISAHRVSASIGVAIFPEHGSTVKGLLANADLAMYQAKEAGRNGWKIFKDDDQTRHKVRERVYWNEMVKRVLEEDSFHVHYQPIMNLRTESISHYEALLRIADVGGEEISSQKFILSAEHSGNIQELDLKIIDRVLKQKACLERRGIALKISVNLSGISFRNPDLLKAITALLEKYQIQASDIIFEITETAAVIDAKHTRETMAAIKELGCQFSLDDFGVGFSSLYYLKQFPFDYVKIDGSFIRNIAQDMDDQVMVRALVDVAQSFGQYTIAEFVENQECVDLLQFLNVDYGQGYYIGEPKSPQALWPEGEG